MERAERELASPPGPSPGDNGRISLAIFLPHFLFRGTRTRKWMTKKGFSLQSLTQNLASIIELPLARILIININFAA